MEQYIIPEKELARVLISYYSTIILGDARDAQTGGVRVMPGGDYGFAWPPHRMYARNLKHLVDLFRYTPIESIITATAWGEEIMRYPDTLGKIAPGYYADVILVDRDPLSDLEILQKQERLHTTVINGHIHKHVVPSQAVYA